MRGRSCIRDSNSISHPLTPLLPSRWYHTTIKIVPYHHPTIRMVPYHHQDGTIPPSGWYHMTILGPFGDCQKTMVFIGRMVVRDHPRMVGWYHTTIPMVPYHHPDGTIPPSGWYHTTIPMVPYHHPTRPTRQDTYSQNHLRQFSIFGD